MIYLFLVFYLCMADDWYKIPVFISDQTPSSFIEEFSPFDNKILLEDPFTIMKLWNSNALKFSLIDLTFRPEYFPYFDEISALSGLKYLTLTANEEFLKNSRRIYSLNLLSNEANAIEKLINWLGLREIILISSSSYKNIKFADLIYSKLKSSVFKYITYNENLDLVSGLNLVQKEIKTTGISSILIIDQGPSLEIIQRSLILRKINDTGSLLIFSSLSIGSVFIEGSLILSQEYLEQSTNYPNYCYLSVINSLNSTESASLTENFSILNIKKSGPVKVGLISSHVDKIKEIIYPGGVTSIGVYKTKELTFLIANGTTEAGQMFNYDLFSYIYKAAIYAVEKVNSENQIPRFKIILRPTDTGLFYYSPAWYSYKLSSALYNPFPILYLTSYWHVSAYGNSEALKSMNISIPQISPFAQKSIVESKDDMPYFVKMSVSEEEFFTNGYNFLKSLGWNSVILYATNDEAFYGMFLVAEKLCKARGINVLNPEHLRVFPQNYSRTDFEKYREYFDVARKSRCKVFLIFAWDRGPIWEGLYDIGYRKGEFYSIGDFSTIEYMSRPAEEQYKKKWRELIVGSFILGYKEWNGDIGQRIYKELSEMYDDDISSFCMCYDTVTVATAALNYALNIGKDYENPKEFMKIIRDIRVKGCMGNIYFSRDNNNIGYAKFQIYQVNIAESGKIYVLPIAI